MYFYSDDKYVLKNELGLEDSDSLNEAERMLTTIRIAKIRKNNYKEFSFKTLKNIHYELFKGIYPWAGKIRNINISKGNTIFCMFEYIETMAEDIFDKLDKKNYLKGLTQEEFCRELAELFGDLNILHPFREGNGRTEREFIYHLAKNAGYELDLTKLSKAEYMTAAIMSVVDCSRMKKLMLNIIKKK
ncbi:Fic family protein [Megamonas hypermegale]|uniref:Fic/DOC family protein n=1 Tax=Megamonas hypermegale TaxID=158847 RepID=UPI0026F29EBB|nr:Fic family protein [Megamonas hypermegale]